MPRKDPVTGVNVMTTAEFFQSEADKEGKGRTAADIADEHYNELIEEQKKEAQRISEPQYVQDAINAYIKDNNDNLQLETYPEDKDMVIAYTVTSVARVWDVHVDFGRCSSEEFKAEVSCSDNKTRTFRYYSWSSPGSYSNPPEGEICLEEI